MKDSIVLYPFLGRGHLMSMVELGKLILTHHPSVSIQIIILNPSNTTPKFIKINQITSQYISFISSTLPSITFHLLPSTPFPPSQQLGFDLARLNNYPNLHQTLHSISTTSNLKAFIMDFFNYSAGEVTASFNIPTFYYFTSGAGFLAVLLHLPTIHRNSTQNFFTIPCLPTLSASDLPFSLEDRTRQRYLDFLNTATCMTKSNGVIINTFELLETTAIGAISEGRCVLDGPTPPIFCIGPLISADPEDDRRVCLSWLDSQPKESVVFLCFGSRGRLQAAQLKEIARGLESSGRRFLWVVKNPNPEEELGDERDLEVLLPEGFLERTRDKGFVALNWAPQVAILSHDSVGGFVTHCGWNSVLEAVSGGIGMVAWPLCAEQKVNRVFMVEEMRIAVGVKEMEDGFVSGDELEGRVRELMESKRGKEVKERVTEMRKGAAGALKEGGSSWSSLSKLAQVLKLSSC